MKKTPSSGSNDAVAGGDDDGLDGPEGAAERGGGDGDAGEFGHGGEAKDAAAPPSSPARVDLSQPGGRDDLTREAEASTPRRRYGRPVPARRDLLLALAAAAAVAGRALAAGPVRRVSGRGARRSSLLALARTPARRCPPRRSPRRSPSTRRPAACSWPGWRRPLAVLVAACLLLGRHARTRSRPPPRAPRRRSTAMTAANQLAPGLDYPALDDLVFFTHAPGRPRPSSASLLRERGAAVARAGRPARRLCGPPSPSRRRPPWRRSARGSTIGVHDALAHRIGEISLQAAGAQRVAARTPAGGPARAGPDRGRRAARRSTTSGR